LLYADVLQKLYLMGQGGHGQGQTPTPTRAPVHIPMKSLGLMPRLRRSTSWLGYFALFFLLLLAPYAWAFNAIGVRAWFRGVAADSMYYLAIANNWHMLGFPTFDWVEPSTGFHPLWMLLLVALLRWTRVPFQAQVFVNLAACMLCLSVGPTLAHRALSWKLESSTKRILLAVSFFPGLYALTLEPVTAQALSVDPGILYRVIPWSAMDGMESSLTLLLQATFVVFAFSESGSPYLGSPDASRRCLWLSIPSLWSSWRDSTTSFSLAPWAYRYSPRER
jgi:hypothetical protein